VVGIGAVEMVRGVISLGELFAMLMLAGKTSAPLLGAANVARQYRQVLVSVSELGCLLDASPDCASVPIPVRIPLTGGVSFRNVTYRYSGSTTPAISGLSVQLPVGSPFSQLCAHGCIVPSSRSGLLYNVREWERERPSHAVTAAPSNSAIGLTRTSGP
jgi:ABC-type multidrug transport system fused ATPase/permease subunit